MEKEILLPFLNQLPDVRYTSHMLAIRLDPAIEKRLALLAKKTGGTKTSWAREAILERLLEIEDARTAIRRLKKPARTCSADEVKSELGLYISSTRYYGFDGTELSQLSFGCHLS